MERNERLLNLIALFLHSHEPVPFARLREEFPGVYDGDAGTRKFERDKAELAAQGVVLDYFPESNDPEDAAGYALARERYYLPRLALTPEELAVLFTAGNLAFHSGTFLGQADLASALRKIGFEGNLAPPASAPLSEHIQSLWRALLTRKRITLRYRSGDGLTLTERAVDPWGICLRRGIWLLVGWCHLRHAQRTFHIDRILELSVNPKQPKTPDFEIPEAFDSSAIAGEQVWEYALHEPMTVTLELGPPLSEMGDRLFPHALPASPGASEDGHVRLTLEVRYLDGLLKHLLPLGPAARLLGPPEALTRLHDTLRAIEARHA